MADDLLSKYKMEIKGLTLIPGQGGCYEVTLNGDLIYSKKQTGQFPTTGQIATAMDGK